MKPLVTLGESPDDCWEWIGSINPKTGYGKKQWHGRAEMAHRWMWMMLFGIIPDGMVINHKCSNRKCVNPHHLEVVTPAENCRHGKATKLSEDLVRRLRKRSPMPRKVRRRVAQRIGISESHLNAVIRGEVW